MAEKSRSLFSRPWFLLGFRVGILGLLAVATALDPFRCDLERACPVFTDGDFPAADKNVNVLKRPLRHSAHDHPHVRVAVQPRSFVQK